MSSNWIDIGCFPVTTEPEAIELCVGARYRHEAEANVPAASRDSEVCDGEGIEVDGWGDRWLVRGIPRRMMRTLYMGGRVFTADPEMLWAESLVTEGELILAVGCLADCEVTAGVDAERIDVGGCVVMPGFVDGHSHLLMTGSALGKAQLRTATTLEEIRRRLVEWAEANPDEPYVLGTSFLFDAVPNNEPTRQMLDDLFPERPVFIDSFDLHCGWVNSAALSLMEITTETPDPIGGEIRRDPATGEATGYLLETALHLHMWAFLARTDDATRDRHLATAMKALNESGTTTAVDMAVSADDAATFTRAEEAGSLSLRVIGHWIVHNTGVAATDLAQVEEAARRKAQHTGPMFRVAGIKLIVDGTIDACTAAMIDPYTNDTNCDPIWPADSLNPVVELADKLGLQVACHAIGDLAVRIAIDAIERAQRVNGTSGRRHRIEHLEYVDAARHSASRCARHHRVDAARSLRSGHRRQLGRNARPRTGNGGLQLARLHGHRGHPRVRHRYPNGTAHVASQHVHRCDPALARPTRPHADTPRFRPSRRRGDRSRHEGRRVGQFRGRAARCSAARRVRRSGGDRRRPVRQGPGRSVVGSRAPHRSRRPNRACRLTRSGVRRCSLGFMNDLLIRSVRPWPREPGGMPVDVLIRAGRIAAIGSDVGGDVAERSDVPSIDGRGGVLLPRSPTSTPTSTPRELGLPFRPHSAGPGLTGLIENDRANWRADGDVATRATRTLAATIASGTTVIRSHAQVDTDARLERLEGVLAAREAHAARCHLQIVAFPQSGIVRDRGTAELLHAAIVAGADLIGGIDPCGLDRDPVEHLDIVFGLAERHQVGVDIHLHESGELGAFTFELIGERTAGSRNARDGHDQPRLRLVLGRSRSAGSAHRHAREERHRARHSCSRHDRATADRRSARGGCTRRSRPGRHP